MAESLTKSQTGPATRSIDAPLIVSGLFFWTAFATACLMAVFAPVAAPVHVATGTARLNSQGDVVSWAADEATGKTERDMLYRDFFRLVPQSYRDEARSCFTRGVLWEPGFKECRWYDGKDAYTVRFARVQDDYVATITRRR